MPTADTAAEKTGTHGIQTAEISAKERGNNTQPHSVQTAEEHAAPPHDVHHHRQKE